ncbi:hypothetical protein FAES_4191 [Fibrella aestuarina BUZ 2]|uniref:Uncharacterized protein n=1 Tax=Fibrella aestuarina BUZ 2 TaxID=1166018 RepID=I0KDI8_9BACT|nr:hypothetical protein [Fibrella aestuarina]CCH02191.1 hypothetical protein FAES_4191 [Fibrella aestuarina BUZ 2]
MNRLCLLLLLLPSLLFAQHDSVQTLRRQDLKPIGNDLVPDYRGPYYGSTVSTQYTYDGLDIIARHLVPYIQASGDPDAIREINAYIRNRHTGGWLIAGGVATMVVGTVMVASNAPNADGKFTTQQPYICPTGLACGYSGGVVYGGQQAGAVTVPDNQRKNAFGAGFAVLLGGGILTGIDWGLNLPGQHVRRAVQYYNRSLRQEQRVSWRLQPGTITTAAGLTLRSRF